MKGFGEFSGGYGQARHLEALHEASQDNRLSGGTTEGVNVSEESQEVAAEPASEEVQEQPAVAEAEGASENTATEGEDGS